MANWRRLPFAASCAVAVAVVGADASCLLAVLAFANLLLIKTRTRPLLGRPRLTPAAAAPAGRQAHWPQRGLAGLTAKRPSWKRRSLAVDALSHSSHLRAPSSAFTVQEPLQNKVI